MKTLFAFIALAVSSHAFATDQKVLAALQPKAGEYALSAQDPKHPCRIDDGSRIRLNVYVPTETTEFEEKGDVMVKLEQWGDSINKWYSLFDRAPFFRINGWSKRSAMIIDYQPVWITHKTTYNFDKGLLQHSGSMSTITGSQAGVQTIQFNADDKIVYSYDIVDYNVLGQVTAIEKAGRCEFTKKQ